MGGAECSCHAAGDFRKKDSRASTCSGASPPSSCRKALFSSNPSAQMSFGSGKGLPTTRNGGPTFRRLSSISFCITTVKSARACHLSRFLGCWAMCISSCVMTLKKVQDILGSGPKILQLVAEAAKFEIEQLAQADAGSAKILRRRGSDSSGSTRRSLLGTTLQPPTTRQLRSFFRSSHRN